MKKEISPVAAIIAIVLVTAVVFGMGWKFLFVSSDGGSGKLTAPAVAGQGPPGFQSMEAERASLRNRKAPQ